MHPKYIVTPLNVSGIAAELRRELAEGASIVFVHGNFNVLHPGHLRLLQFARECGDLLVVGVNSNRQAGRAALIDEHLRIQSVLANNWVDKAFMLDLPVEDFLQNLKPDIVVKGKEYEGIYNAEEAVLASYGGVLQFGSGDTVFSASNLLRQELSLKEANTIPDSALRFAENHGFGRDSLRTILQSARRVRIGVIGDVIVDEYITCDPLGMSQEDPTIVVAPVASDKFLGGAAIVAAHCAGLGAQVRFFTVTGDDELRPFIQSRLDDYRVVGHLVTDETRPSTLKQRFRAAGKTMLRVNHVRQHGIRSDLQKQMLEQIISALDDLDIIVFSDFNYGCLPQSLVDGIVMEARKRGKLIIADSQCSSQIGDVSRFKGADILTPTEMEARVSTRNHEDGLVVLAEKLRKQAGAKNVILKLGAEGVLVHAAAIEGEWHTDQIPAFCKHPKDTAGAGDSLLAATAIATSLGASIWQAAYLGSLAASCQVSRIGNIPIKSEEILAVLGGEWGINRAGFQTPSRDNS